MILSSEDVFTFEGYISEFQGNSKWNPGTKQKVSICQYSLMFSKNQIGVSMIKNIQCLEEGIKKGLKNECRSDK